MVMTLKGINDDLMVLSNKRKGFVTQMALGASSLMGLKFGRSKPPVKPTPTGRFCVCSVIE